MADRRRPHPSMRANGVCGMCDGPVPGGAPNLFYCSDACRAEAWAWNVAHRTTGDPRIDNVEDDDAAAVDSAMEGGRDA